MLKMTNLIRNENMKLSHRASTWIMMVIVVLFVVVIGLVVKFSDVGNKQIDTDWKKTLTEQNVEYQKSIDQPGMIKSSKLQFEGIIKINEYRIENNRAPLKDNSVWEFVSLVIQAKVVSFIALFTIIIGGGIVANEFSAGTIKLLLIRPSKRWKILISKYITTIMYAFFMLLIAFIASFIVGGILCGFSGTSEPFFKYANGKVTEVNMVVHIIGLYGLKCIDLIMMVSLAFMISSVLRSSALAIGIGVFLLTMGSLVTNGLAQFFTWPKYILFANTDLIQYINGSPLIEGMTMSFSIIVIIIYFVIFNTISFLGFTKRDVAA